MPAEIDGLNDVSKSYAFKQSPKEVLASIASSLDSSWKQATVDFSEPGWYGLSYIKDPFNQNEPFDQPSIDLYWGSMVPKGYSCFIQINKPPSWVQKQLSAIKGWFGR
jgi:hypothetical protein